MVTLSLNTDQPDPVRQVLLWLKQPSTVEGASAETIPAFQIVGFRATDPTVPHHLPAKYVSRLPDLCRSRIITPPRLPPADLGVPPPLAPGKIRQAEVTRGSGAPRKAVRLSLLATRPQRQTGPLVLRIAQLR